MTKPPPQQRTQTDSTFGRVLKKVFGVLAVLLAGMIILGIVVRIATGQVDRRIITASGTAIVFVAVGMKWLLVD